MATDGNQIKQKISKNYCCELCDYTTVRKSNFDAHNLSSKHKTATNCHNAKQKLSNKFECEFCNKTYRDRTGLWKHNSKNNCSIKGTNIEVKKDEPVVTNNTATDKDELINYLMKENQEFKNLILEIVKKDTHNNCNNTTTNSHNKAFNLNFFLNETCKDAMNIMDFVDSIKLQLSDLEKVGEVGYVEGISNIIVKNLNELDVTLRPVHCTDKKRETMYIKDEDKWEKDENNSKIKKAIKRVASKNQRLLPKFKEAHPDCGTYHSKYSDQYNKIIIESVGGSGDNDAEKEEKIIRNISKNVVVEK
jgi:ribosomal protein L37AE/L43A